MSALSIVKWTYSNDVESGYTLIPLVQNPQMQQFFLQLATQLKNLDVTINDDVASRLGGCLKERFQMIQKQQLRLIYKYMHTMKPLLELLASASNKTVNQRVRKEVQWTLNEVTKELVESLEDLKAKARFIRNLKQRHCEYYNVIDEDLGRIDNPQALERILMKNTRHGRILCSSDALNTSNPSKLEAFLQQLTSQRARCVYADFSYSFYNLPDMMLFPSNAVSTTIPPSTTPDHDIINVLLLGETGVGKSTFINAFVNYLTFDTLNQAEMNEPVALIPASFLLTTGDHFDEHLIKYGDSDKSNNEDFTHPGQSVTQHCKSHRFDLRRDLGKKLCIIDTPGFGDTRGLEQDDLNMKHILKYVNNLTHLNAVCFLLKPNESRLNIFFRTCLTQLLDLFGSGIRQNILFAFTNARSTSYTPGNTAPLLRTMLNSLSIQDIPFRKENTFCFDSESFRYLVALQNGIQFNEEDKQEYELSWKTSAKESNRLLNYVHTQLNIYPLHSEWQSNKHAQIEVAQMVRPMCEAMRNILRNMIMRKMDSSNKYIKCYSKPIHYPTGFCLSCRRDPFPLGHFWILPDHPHRLQDQCLTCTCTMDQHISIDYLLSYDISNDSSSPKYNEMNLMLEQLYLASAEFAYFLLDIARSTKDDPFLIGLMRMIGEEKQICSAIEGSDHLNFQLLKELETLKRIYVKEIEKVQSNPKHQNLQTIYKQMQTIYELPVIHDQMIAIKEKRETSTEMDSS